MAGAASTASARWGRPIGLPAAMRPSISASSSSKPSSSQRRGHAQRALLAVGEELGEPLGEDRAGVVDAVAEDVQFARLLRVRVDRRDLDRGDHAHAVALARAIASATPATVSWSLSASSSTPARAARSTTSAASSAPSEWVECDCRSKRSGGI